MCLVYAIVLLWLFYSDKFGYFVNVHAISEFSTRVIEEKLSKLRRLEEIYVFESFSNRPYLSWYKNNSIQLSVFKRQIRLTMQSAILNRKHKIVMCTVPKVACTEFRKFMLLLQTPKMAKQFDKFDKGVNYTGVGKFPLWNSKLNRSVLVPNVHNLRNNPIQIMIKQPANIRWQVYNSPEYLKVFHVRNPITRVLSAYLSKNNDSAYPMKFAKYNATFNDFIHVSIRL